MSDDYAVLRQMLGGNMTATQWSEFAALVAGYFKATGAEVRVDALDSYLEVHGRDCILSVEPRPVYCNRGRFVVKPRLIPGKTEVDLSIDWADGFPRYYFSAYALMVEIRAWLQARDQI